MYIVKEVFFFFCQLWTQSFIRSVAPIKLVNSVLGAEVGGSLMSFFCFSGYSIGVELFFSLVKSML